jgi:hypothetical protein
VPWDREKTGSALVDTAKRLIAAPGAAFAEVREKGDYLSPALFAAIVGTLGALFAQIWGLLLGGAMATGLADMLPPEMRATVLETLQPSPVVVAVNLLVAPFLAVVLAFVGAVIIHLCLLLIGGTRESTAGFEGTFRVVAYGWVANLAQVIPLLGGFWWLWGIVLWVLGLARVHRTSSGKAVAAILLPLALCCAGVLLISLFLFLMTGVGLLEFLSRIQR